MTPDELRQMIADEERYASIYPDGSWRLAAYKLALANLDTRDWLNGLIVLTDGDARELRREVLRRLRA